MKNVTITLDEEVARWARIRAAELDMSLSRMVGEMLRDQMLQEDAYGQAMREWLEASDYSLPADFKYPKREEFYDRPVLRRYERSDLYERQAGFAEADEGQELDRPDLAGSRRRDKPSDSE